MGAYENPITAIDTKSGEIWANAARSISNSVYNAIQQKRQKETDQQKEAQADLDYTFNYTLKNQDEVNKRLAESGATNEQPFEVAYGLMNKKTMFELDAKRAKTPEQQTELLKAAGKYGKALETFYVIQKSFVDNDTRFKEEFIDNIDKVGQEGGVPMIGEQNKKYNLAMSIRNGINPGKEEFKYDEDSASWKVIYTGERLKANGFDKIEMDASVLAAYDPGKIPEISKKIGGLFSAKSDKNPQGLGINGTDDYPSDDYLDFSKVTYIYSEDGKFRTPVIPTKMEKIANGSKVLLTSQAEGYLSDPSTAQVVWQNLLAQKGDTTALKINPSGGGFISADDKELFIQRYVEKAKDFVKPFKYGKTEPVPVTTKGVTKEGATQAKVYNKAKTLTDDVLRANSGKNSRFFINKELDGMSISSAQWSGDTLNLVLDKPSGDGITEIPRKFEMNRREDVEDLVALLAQERYGKDASAEEIRDMTSMILRERQKDGKPKINTSYE